MNDIIAVIIGSIIGMILGFYIAQYYLTRRYGIGRPGFNDIYYQGKKIEAKDIDSTAAFFIPDPTKQALENLKDPELSDFYETIEKPAKDED